MPHRAVPTAGTLLHARIAEQTAVLAGLEPDVRADAPDAVHRMRVACRRLRAALRPYGPPLAGLGRELRWLGAALGQARDSEVLGELLIAQARELPPDCEPQALAAALADWSRDRYVRAWPAVTAALDSPRYPALLGALRELADSPPEADLPGIGELARREQRRTASRLRKARRAAPGEESDRALHEARKAAKWARYAGETAGAPGERFTARMKALQELLGAHQDSVVAREALRELAGGADGQRAFGYGVLYGGQLAVAERARERLPEVWRKARKPPGFS
ncbi:CHAD domain-containing protein [Kitasatospora sp. GP82]|uniref:CHAD domain-containing protein n=1 Tax=Kitasatospora sp. GP82 TaxID=3035089 RepID=UPI0024763BE3|nr:CHAD domain-containing protein [Kitasatospora sp. GP82]MDH6124746.1 CHAD domain-containing protein [Kitasatospora sp. GP82]